MKIPKLLVLGTLLVALCMVVPAMASQVDLKKNTDRDIVYEPAPNPENMYYVGDTIHYVLRLTNPVGNPATNTINEFWDVLPDGSTHYFISQNPLNNPDTGVALVQTPGQLNTYYIDYTVTGLETFIVLPNGNNIVNNCYVSGIDSLFDTVTASAQRNSLVLQPDTLVTITATPNSGMFPITTDLVVTEQNTGTDPVTAVSVSVYKDDGGGPVLVATLVAPPNSGDDGDGILEPGAPGETWTWNTGALLDIVLTKDTTFTALGTGLDALGNEVSFATGYLGEKAEASVDGEYPPPCIDVTKTVNCDEATVGATVTYRYCITNCSTLEMHITNIADNVVTDAVVAAAFMAAHAADDTLNPAEQVCFDVPYVIKVTDADPLINTVRVDAEDTSFQQATYDEATARVDILIPCLLLEKSCTSLDPVQRGGVAFFRITLTNCGDLDLMVDVTDADDTDCDALLDGQLAVGASTFCDLAIDIPLDFSGTEFINHVTATWATIPNLPCVTLIEDTENDEVPCEVTGGATRTPGFWKTHTTFAEHVLQTHCGGVLDLGFVELETIDEICAYFWANKANNTDGSKRSKLCQARMHAAFHAIAALLNNCVPSGGGIPVSPAEIATILGGTDIEAIKALASELAAYNESGDDVALIDPDASPGSATPQECKAYDQSIADCLGPAATGNGKGPK